MSTKVFGYGRISSLDQDPDLQIEALLEAGVPRNNIFIDKASGKNMDQPKLKELKNRLRGGDEIAIWKLNRIGKSIWDLINTLKELEEKKVNFKSIKENFDTKTPKGKYFFSVVEALAEYERSLVQEKVLEGIQSAKKRGTKFGRPIKANEEIQRKVIELNNQGIPKKEICRRLGISRSTIYRAINAPPTGRV